MSDLFINARIVDLIIGFMLFELMVLIIVRKKTGKGPPAGQLLAFLGAGFALLMALRTALLHGPWTSMAVWLLLALCAHLADIFNRWRST